MSVSSVAVVLLLLCGAQRAAAQENIFYGTVMTYDEAKPNGDGTQSVGTGQLLYVYL